MEPGRFRLPRRVFVALVFGLALASASVAMAVDLRGTLRVPSDFAHAPPTDADEARRDRYVDEWNGFLPPRDVAFDAARELAVVLTGPGPMADEQPPLRISNGDLYPRTMIARSNSTLRIQNTDPCSHELFAEGHAELGPSATSPGLTRQAVIHDAGSWPVQDALYPHVRGHLHVIDDLVARASIASDGSYHFTNVPAGTYTLKVFYLANMVHSTEVVVDDSGREVTIDAIRLTTSDAVPASPAPAEEPAAAEGE